MDAGLYDSYLWSDNSTDQTLVPDFSIAGNFTFSVSVENQFECISEDDINIEVQDCALLTEMNKEEIIFYPNPFRDVVYSNMNLEDYEIEVFNLSGKIVPICIKANKIYFNKSSSISIVELIEKELGWTLIIK